MKNAEIIESLEGVIRALKEDVPKYDGEPCELPPMSHLAKDATGYRFEYTGEHRSPLPGEWWSCDGYSVAHWVGGGTHAPRWILRAVPLSAWKAGDWAWCETWQSIGEITKIDGLFYEMEAIPFGIISGHVSHLRPLTDEDWTGEIGGVRVRAYDDADGSIRVVCADDTFLWAFARGNNDDTVLRTLCREHDIPIMPEKLHQGVCKKPEDGK